MFIDHAINMALPDGVRAKLLGASHTGRKAIILKL